MRKKEIWKKAKFFRRKTPAKKPKITDLFDLVSRPTLLSLVS